MKCPKCATEVSSEAVMCPKCGAFTGEPEKAEQPEKKESKVKAAYIIAAVLGVIIIVALVVLLMLPKHPITQADAPVANSGPAVTNVPPAAPSGGPAVTNAPPQTPTPAPANTVPAKMPPPQEVVDYLNFVKDIEQRRQTLLADTTRAVAMSAGTAQAQSMIDAIDMAMDDSGQTRPKKANAVEDELGKHIVNWYSLVRLFDTKPAPQQCAEFSGNYRLVLTNEASGIAKILTVVRSTDWTNLQSIQSSLTQLQAMKSDPNLQGNIDKAVDTSNTKLTDLCSNYAMDKPFEIKKEEGGGSIIGGGL